MIVLNQTGGFAFLAELVQAGQFKSVIDRPYRLKTIWTVVWKLTLFVTVWLSLLAPLTILMSMAFPVSDVFAQTDSAVTREETDGSDGRYSIGSSLFLFGNFAPGDPPSFFLLNYEYRLTRDDIIFAEAITWTYYEPLGTYGSSDKRYPGKIRAYGMGVGYQHFLWNKLYLTAQATPFVQRFIDENGTRINSGFQLYLQSRLGYRFEFSNERLFGEPSVAFNYWPVNTNLPDAFKEIEKGKPNYILFEPGLYFGIRF